MTEKKIAECINIRINVGNYQHIELTKYAEKTISYQNEKEMIQQEDQLTEELLINLIRNMRRIPERLGKETKATVEVEESIAKTIPEWLKNGDVPNIANKAKDSFDRVKAEQKEQKDSQDVLKSADKTDKKSTKPEETDKVANEDVEEVTSSPSATDDFDLFDDEDLFK
jgi:hypothetical protein